MSTTPAGHSAPRPRITTASDYRAWLLQQPAEKIVGLRLKIGRCPLSEWLRAQGARDPFVCWEAYSVELLELHTVYYRVPEWAKAFLIREEDVTSLELSAAKCLELLDRVQSVSTE